LVAIHSISQRSQRSGLAARIERYAKAGLKLSDISHSPMLEQLKQVSERKMPDNPVVRHF
jgi:hypothetical protein